MFSFCDLILFRCARARNLLYNAAKVQMRLKINKKLKKKKACEENSPPPSHRKFVNLGLEIHFLPFVER